MKERKKTIYCPACKLTFDIKFLQILEDEDILANEELEGIIDAFAEDTNDLELIL